MVAHLSSVSLCVRQNALPVVTEAEAGVKVVNDEPTKVETTHIFWGSFTARACAQERTESVQRGASRRWRQPVRDPHQR